MEIFGYITPAKVGWETWQRFDSFMVGLADELWVLTLDGWKDSVGVKAEVVLALGLGKTVRYVTIHAGVIQDERGDVLAFKLNKEEEDALHSEGKKKRRPSSRNIGRTKLSYNQTSDKRDRREGVEL